MRTFKGRIQFPNGASQEVVLQADNQYKATLLAKSMYQGVRIRRSFVEVK